MSKVGKKVLVTLSSKEGQLHSATPIVQKISVEYFGGTIKTNSGDLWKVIPYMGGKNSEAEFITVE